MKKISKILISKIGEGNENILLTLYPQTQRAFLSIRMDEVTTKNYPSSNSAFIPAIKAYFNVELGQDSAVSDFLKKLAKNSEGK